MRVSKQGEWLRGSHITGPTHNFLGLRLHKASDAADFEVVVLPPVGTRRLHAGLNADEAKAWIIEGVQRANHEIGTDYFIEHAEIVENDSYRPEIYTELARRIVLAKHAEDAA